MPAACYLLLSHNLTYAQVETLRDKVSSLSRDLATAPEEHSGPHIAPCSVEASTEDASVAHEMQALRKELCEAQAALDAQMPMVSLKAN